MLQRIRAWGRLLLATCLASSCVGVARAQDDDYLPQWYAGPLAGLALLLKAYCETKPTADNKTDEGRATNRRVEFRRLNP